MRHAAALAAVLACMLTPYATAQGPGMAGAREAPAEVSALAPDLRLRGTGTYRWLGLKVYDAALWTPGAAREDFARPLALMLRYARSLKGSAIAERSVEEIENLGLGSAERRRAWGVAMAKLFPDVVEGTTLTGVHLPGRGARFFHDGRPLGEIADAEFSHAFFSIWLDAKTGAPALRAALLGER